MATTLMKTARRTTLIFFIINREFILVHKVSAPSKKSKFYNLFMGASAGKFGVFCQDACQGRQ
jgi:hypothetical protein